MPAPTSSQEMLDLVRKSELIPPPHLEAFLKPLQKAGPLPAPRELAKLLVSAGFVTQFQVEQLLQGKWRGFAIGKYKVLEKLGSGGMGTVYLCEHAMVGRKVAVKVLPTSQASNPSALGRFYREARAAGVLDHPNLVKAHDVDEENGLHYLVMDYVDGSSLQEIVSRFGPLSPLRACHYISGAATGLEAAHGGGLVHRDVKPANILIERNGVVRVLDLGLARFFNDHNDLLTLKYDDNTVLGTADYVSPEQAQNSHEVDIRTDIYSLGATFYFCLTGHPPFPTGKIAQKLIWHQTRQPKPIRELRPEVPREVAAIVEQMMEKELPDRFQTPGEVVKALAKLTREPIAPPSEAEMPRLSLAATVAPSSQRMNPLPKKADPPGAFSANREKRPAPVAVASAPERRVAERDRTPCAGELPMPRGAKKPETKSPQAKSTAPAVSPSKLIAQAAQQNKSGWVASALFVILMLIGCAAGIGLMWWKFR